MILGSYGSKGLMPYGFEKEEMWCEFEWRYKGAIYSRLVLGGVSKAHDLVLTHGRASQEGVQAIFAGVEVYEVGLMARILQNQKKTMKIRQKQTQAGKENARDGNSKPKPGKVKQWSTKSTTQDKFPKVAK
ncbi:hypothetical protein Tco_0854223 [Tanacetum coccineum]